MPCVRDYDIICSQSVPFAVENVDPLQERIFAAIRVEYEIGVDRHMAIGLARRAPALNAVRMTFAGVWRLFCMRLPRIITSLR